MEKSAISCYKKILIRHFNIKRGKMQPRKDIRLFVLVGMILALGLAACASGTPTAEPQGDEATSAPEAEAEATQVDENGYPVPESGGGVVTIDAASACDIVTQEQVEAAFGKPVTAVNPDDQAIGGGCEYVFNADTQTEFQVSVYGGEAARSYFAGLTEALGSDCNEFANKIFDIDFLTSPTSSEDVSATPLGELYTAYSEALSNCMFVQNTPRPDVGANVVTAETIFLNWSSNVAVLGDEQVVEFSYQEPISADAQAAFQGVTDKESMYTAAQPYRDSVLAGYTETLIGLLHEATMQ
jgi:hypothetical protein